MDLSSAKKNYKNGTHRVKNPNKTLNEVEELANEAGVTRVADITGLDRIGIPVYTSIRPNAKKGAISVYNGKGVTKREAKTSAIMEAIERYSAEYRNQISLKTDSYTSFDEKALKPDNLILPRQIRQVDNAKLKWVKGYDLVENQKIWVPSNSVFHPLESEKLGVKLFKTNTNGLAAGNTKEEAILHGLCELIERDAWSLAEASKNPGNLIEVEENSEISGLINRFEKKDVKIWLWDITSDLKIPTFVAVSEDLRKKDPRLLTMGMGTHPNSSIAMKRALTEVAQSRLTQIHGAREDATKAKIREKIGIEETKERNKHWFNSNEKISLEKAKEKSVDKDDILDEIQNLRERLREKGFKRIIVVDLTRKSINIPVVRVIVPGLEVYALDNSRIGKRVKDEKRRSSNFFRSKS